MLEYGFNELDNDFVTLWSKKIVSGEDTIIFKDLTKLAELGQINAMQSWYFLAKNGDDNAVIDNLVDNLGNGGANELLAIAHKDFFVNGRLVQMCAWWKLHSLGFSMTDEQDEKCNNLRYEIQSSEYANCYRLAIEMYYNNYKNTHNPLVLERFYEMMGGRTKIHKKLIDIEARASSREFRNLRKTLLEMYEQDKNNVAVAFALGKNLTLFKSNNFLKALGSKILTELSNRELSQTLQDYEVKGTKRLIKQQIDANAQAEVQDDDLSADDRYIQEVFENVEKTGIKFLGNHRVGALTPEQIGITDKDSKQTEEFVRKATQKFNELDAKGKTTVIKPEITEEELRQAIDSSRHHDTERGQYQPHPIVVRTERTIEEVEQTIESVRKNDAEHGSLL